jgi:hypothetical protein
MPRRDKRRSPLTKFTIYPPENLHETIVQLAEENGLTIGQQYVIILRDGMRLEIVRRMAIKKATEQEIIRQAAKFGDNRDDDYGLL